MSFLCVLFISYSFHSGYANSRAQKLAFFQVNFRSNFSFPVQLKNYLLSIKTCRFLFFRLIYLMSYYNYCNISSTYSINIKTYFRYYFSYMLQISLNHLQTGPSGLSLYNTAYTMRACFHLLRIFHTNFWTENLYVKQYLISKSF